MIRQVWNYMEGRRRAVVALAVTGVITGVAEAWFLVLVTRIALALTGGDEQVSIVASTSVAVSSAIVLAVATIVVRLALAIGSSSLAASVAASLNVALRTNLAQAYLGASWAEKQRDAAGKLQELVTVFARRGHDLINACTNAISAACNLLAILVLAFVLEPIGSLVIILVTAVLASVLRPLRKAIRRSAIATTSSSTDLATALAEASQMGVEMHTFNIEAAVEERLRGLVLRDERANRRLTLLRNLLPVSYTTLAYAAVVLSLGAIAALDVTEFGSLGPVMLVMLRSLSYGQNLQTTTATIASSLPFLDSLKVELERYRAAAPSSAGIRAPQISEIELAAVTFAYQEGHDVLSEVDLRFGAREIVGIVGPSGSGKSTLVQLLLGLRRPTTGRVLAGGVDVADLDPADRARRITFVPQSSHLVVGTVSDNIRFMRAGVDQAEIERAARLAHLHDEILTWPGGYDFRIGTDGGSISGGQQQRLSIARALVERPDFLVLDEPTSALDVRSEAAIRAMLSELRREMTVIVIAHRMSTLDICDRIIVVQDGRVVGDAPPSELRRTSAFFREALELSGIS